jgi:tetratricopeptide (TPR) repeat protein
LQKEDVDLESTANRLGIQYLISGSVQCTGKRMRVIAQLENPREGTLLWSDTYDADIDDVLAVERNVAGAIAGAFGGERLKMEIRRAKSRSKTDLDAWGLVQRARHYLINYDLEALNDAVSFLERAIDIDANYAAAHAMLGSVISEKVINCVSVNPDMDRAKARELVERARSLEPRDSFVARMTGCVFAYCGDYDRAIRILRRAVKAFDHDLGAWGYMGWPLIASGRPEDLAELKTILARLMESAGNHPGAVYWRFHRSVARTAEDDYAGAIDDARLVIDEQPKFALGWMHYANVLGYLGEVDAAREAVDLCESSNPAMTPQAYASLMSSLTDQESVVQMRTGGLRAASLI